jgi:hypothetical protein
VPVDGSELLVLVLCCFEWYDWLLEELDVVLVLV